MARQLPSHAQKIPYLIGLLALSGLLFLGSPAEAGPFRDKLATTPVRDGLTMGASVGRGSIDVRCATCVDAKLTEAVSASGHVGYMVTPRLAVVGEYWLVRFKDRGSTLFDDSEVHLVSQHNSALAAQVFVTERLWIKGGFGFGWHFSDGDYRAPAPSVEEGMPTNTHSGAMTKSEDVIQGLPEGPAQGTTRFVALGVELAHNHVFSADIQLRAAKTSFPSGRYEVYNTGLNVGFNWY